MTGLPQIERDLKEEREFLSTLPTDMITGRSTSMPVASQAIIADARSGEWFSAKISPPVVQRGAYDMVQTVLSPSWYSVPSHGVPQMCKYE